MHDKQNLTMTKNMTQCGVEFSGELLNKLREQIAFVDHDPSGERIYFENAGGSLTLKACCEISSTASKIPDFPNRPTPGARPLQQMLDKSLQDCHIMFGSDRGSILADLTVSKAINRITEVIMAATPGTNVVTTDLDHPATYDSCMEYGELFGCEVRSGAIDKRTGAVDVEDLISKMDKNTSLLSMIHASNVTGTLNDVEQIVRRAREINPDMYILLDCTQHIPHGAIDVESLQIDAATFAPYKILGKRGLGIGWVSDRVAKLPHPHFTGSSETEWDYGGYEPAGMANISIVMDYICSIGAEFSSSTDRRTLYMAGMEAIEYQERSIIYRILHGTPTVPGVNDIEGVTIHFVDDLTKRDCILPMTFDSVKTTDAVEKLVNHGIYVYHRSVSNKMSRRILEGAGLESVVRIAPMHYNTQAEIERFLRVTTDIAAGRI